MDFDIIKGFLDALKPIPRLTVSEWADENRVLSSKTSAEPGRWRTQRTPYLKEIMDKLSDVDEATEIIVKKGAQLGFTEAGNNWVGYVIHIAPAPIMMVMPTGQTIQRNSKLRIAPMIENTPELRKRIPPARSRDSGNTALLKEFPGGVLVLAGANSAAGLRSMPIKNLFLDEVDAYPPDVGNEGSPIELARARTRTFSRKKIFQISTPTVEGGSAIDSEFQQTDQRYYYVPCPHCEHKQQLVFENLVWKKGEPETTKYKCESCKELIEERFKTYMLENGEWRATELKNESRTKFGYHINSLYSPHGWYSWRDAVDEHEKSEGDTLKEKTFTNTVLAETWKEKGEVPKWEALYNKREQYDFNVAPTAALFITVGVDVQKDRLELEIVGWCKNKESYSLDYRVLIGETTGEQVWDELAQVVHETWPRMDGVDLPMSTMAVDSGYNTQYVYDFCRRFSASKVIPIKGQDKQKVLVQNPRPVDVNRKGKKIGRVQVWNVGVSELKTELYGFLKKDISPEDGIVPKGYCHFPEYGVNFFKGITAERKQYRIHHGYRVYYWYKHFERNEPLDCRNYARAAASVLGLDRLPNEKLEKLSLKLRGVNPKSNPANRPKRKRDSSIW